MTLSSVIATDTVDPSTETSRVGGYAMLRADLSWPQCGGCSQPLGFLAQIEYQDDWLVLFACNGFGNGCGGAPSGVGTVALLAPRAAAALRAPPEDAVAGTLAFPAEAIEVVLAPKPVGARLGGDTPEGMIIGQLGAFEEWAQDEVALECSCGKAMEPLLQLDEAWGMTTATYTVICHDCRRAALIVQGY